MQQAILITFLIFGTSLALSPSISKQYRDYEYNRKTDAFYKLHYEHSDGTMAKRICRSEGAQLMIPSNKEDIAQLHGMLKQFPYLSLVYVGNDGQNHYSGGEVNIVTLYPKSSKVNNDDDRCKVYNRSEHSAEKLGTTPCHDNLPFICKVKAKDAPYDELCDVFANDYKYYDNVKSCYKVWPSAYWYTWYGAYDVCRAEKAHLVVLNSKVESQTVKEFLETAPISHPFLFAGIIAPWPTNETKRVFRTIFNQTLEEAGFNEWSDGDPNIVAALSSPKMEHEYCGTIFSKNGKYKYMDCYRLFGFICEKEVGNTR